MTEDISYEKIIANVEKIAGILGVGFSSLSSSDLYKAQTFLSEKLGENVAETVIRLAESMAKGNNPQKEMGKLQKKVASFNSPSQSISSKNAESQISNPPFYRRIQLLFKRLPKSDRVYSRGLRNRSVHRGPNRYK